MAVIVSDTTPLNYLILIDAVEILPRLYGRVLIPPAVREELNQSSTPKRVTGLAASAARLARSGQSYLASRSCIVLSRARRGSGCRIGLGAQGRPAITGRTSRGHCGSRARIGRHRHARCSGSSRGVRLGGLADNVRAARANHVPLTHATDGHTAGAGRRTRKGIVEGF